MSNPRLAFFVLPFFAALLFYASPTTAIVVTNTNNLGAGSLRQAIIDANASPDVSQINFNIPGAGPHTITVLSQLPNITEQVVIDGYSQPGAVVNTNGQWQADNAVIKIVLSGGGTVTNGLVLQADLCVIRGLAVRSFASANIYVTAGFGSQINGCFIGLDPNGTTFPSVYGIRTNASFTFIGSELPEDRNVICGASDSGVLLELGAGSESWVKNNFIGTDATGTLDRGNYNGVFLRAKGVLVSGNLISGNEFGINLFLVDPDGTEILGNRIGTDVTGTLALGNSSMGMQLAGDFGGFATVGSSSAPNLIAFNTITGITVTTPFASGYAIDHNEIHSNGKGIVVLGEAIMTATGNSIHDNVGLGIDLNDNGVTPNDVGDGDIGPNGLQNFPTVATVGNLGGGGVSIGGSLSSQTNQFYTIECFASPACDGSGNGEGRLYIGTTISMFSGGSGTVNYTINSGAGIPGGWYVTATARNDFLDATSEFSTCRQYINTPVGAAVLVKPVDATLLQGPLTMTYSNVTNPGITSLTIADNGPPPPGSLSFGEDPVYYNLSTTATFTGSIQICITYDDSILIGPESALKVMHYDAFSGTWVDITTSRDLANNILCGTSTSLSPFVIAQPTQTTGVDTPPSQYALYPCAPNPFNPSTTIRYDVPDDGVRVSIGVYDVSGRLVRMLVDGVQPAGQNTARWDGSDSRGQNVASGVYFYRMTAGQFTQTRKMVLLK